MDIIWDILKILGAIIAIWIIYKRIIPLTPIKSWSTENKVKIIIASIGVLLIGGVFLTVHISSYGKSGIEIKKSIINLDVNNVESLKIKPDSIFQGMTIIKNPIIIKEITEMELFSKEFSRLVEFMPNHPRTDWSVDIEIEFKNKTKRYMEINKSKDENGVMIQIYKKAWGGRLYIGMFRNDNLGLLIEHTIEKYNLNK